MIFFGVKVLELARYPQTRDWISTNAILRSLLEFGGQQDAGPSCEYCIWFTCLYLLLMCLAARVASAQNPKAQGGGPFKE